MTSTTKTFLCMLLACLFLLSPTTGRAQGTEGKVSLDFKDIELTDLVQTIGELTGKNFLFDEKVKGKVTIISPESMSLDEAYQLFLTVLNVKGFTVVPSGKVNKIVPIKTARTSNLPTVSADRRRAGGERFVTRLVRLKNIDASMMATTVLAPLIPKTSNIVAYPPSNTLVITDSAANIERLVKIVNELDVPSALDRLEVITLENASAEVVAPLLTQVITQKAPATKRAKGAANVRTAGAGEVSKILPYSRTNTLLIMATDEDLATIKSLLVHLDQKASQERSHINVYYLENADAETLGKTLNEIITGIAARPRSAGKAGAKAAKAPLARGTVSITADKPTNSLIVNATPEDYEIIKGIVSQLDIKRKQVYVEALIMELSMNATKNLGVSLQGAIETGSDSVIFASTGPSAATPLISTDDDPPSLLTTAIDGIRLGGLFNLIEIPNPADPDNPLTVPALSALIDISKGNSDINILSAPRLLTSDNEEAEIVVGSNVPIITSRLTDTGGGDALAQSVSVERQDVALTLRFTPQITQGDLVRLNVHQEITELVEEDADIVTSVGPTLTKRLLRNTVLAQNGRTVVLGGLISSNVQEVFTKVPMLGDIPLLGWLFKKKRDAERKVNLLIFITPHIVKDAGDLAKVTQKAKSAMDIFHERDMTEPEATERLGSELMNSLPEEKSGN